MVVGPFALPALIAAAASLPTGLGFGAGYGAGVRLGYDVLYPALAPFARQFVGGIIGAVKTVWDPNGSPGDVPDKTGGGLGAAAEADIVSQPKGKTGKSTRVSAAADPCVGIQSRARSLQKELLKLQRNLSTIQPGKRGGSTVAFMKKRQTIVATELNALLNNPNNRQCVEGMKF